jgi:cation/acetate symporter
MGEVKSLAVSISSLIVALVLFVSFYSARRSRSASGYYAAGGRIHWGVNGIAFAGDYLSAASFLGICGMIATAGYDGFLYSIGYLAGWVVALFVVAEPMRRLGRYTFTDALDAKFNKRSIKLFAALATLIVSIFYLIPQMVGAGVLIEPLLGFPHWVGVVLVGAIVITIVATAGMTSTTYVQFIKGSLLILFALVIVVALCVRGLSTQPDQGGRVPFYDYKTITATQTGDAITPDDPAYRVVGTHEAKVGKSTVTFVQLQQGDKATWWKADIADGKVTLHETQEQVTTADGQKLINGAPASSENKLRLVGHMSAIDGDPQARPERRTLSPICLGQRP